MKCYECNQEVADNEVSMEYNMPELGHFCWCIKCLPIQSPEEIVQSLDDFLNPAKENPDNESWD